MRNIMIRKWLMTAESGVARYGYENYTGMMTGKTPVGWKQAFI